jgi:multiple sugar transport system permease protein
MADYPRQAAPLARTGRALGAAVVAFVFAGPLLLLLSGSVHRPGQPPPPRPALVPDQLSLEGYQRAVELAAMGRAAANSLLVAAVAVPVSVLVASLAGFALARLRGRITTVVVVASLFALMVPATSLLVPRFALFRWLGLTGTLVPLVAPALIATSPLYVLVYYLAFRALPADLYDACRLEDLTPRQTWWRVGLPLVRPVTGAVAALSFLLTWSNFLDPLVYVYDRDLYTLPLAVRSLATVDPTDFPVFLAGAVLATGPALFVLGLVPRRFLRRNEGWL